MRVRSGGGRSVDKNDPRPQWSGPDLWTPSRAHTYPRAYTRAHAVAHTHSSQLQKYSAFLPWPSDSAVIIVLTVVMIMSGLCRV